MKVMSMLRYYIPSGGDILLNFTHTIVTMLFLLQNGELQRVETTFYTIYSDFCIIMMNLNCITT